MHVLPGRRSTERRAREERRPGTERRPCRPNGATHRDVATAHEVETELQRILSDAGLDAELEGILTDARAEAERQGVPMDSDLMLRALTDETNGSAKLSDTAKGELKQRFQRIAAEERSQHAVPAALRRAEARRERPWRSWRAVLSERQKRTLEALCDTWVPAVDPDGSDPVEASFLARPAAEIGVADQIEGLMADAMTPDEIAATAELLDALADRGLRGPDRSTRARTW